MDASNLRRCVWEEMLFADMRANYFAELVRHYLMLDKWMRVATLVAASGTLGTALAQVDSGIRLAVPIVATAISFWLLISQYGSLARDASDLHSGWNAIKRDYERLWNNLSSDGAAEDYYRIYDEAEVLSKSGTKFPNKTTRLSHWLDEAAKMASARYA
ncbi:MAG TPA: hypothetical protein VHU83_14750 [Bryobacteraceae bacterium]|jgi:hypothetical protein|nr:hypothetical protein [Bryobacteraceae bacterium]